MATNTTEYMSRWYSEHKEERREYMRRYYRENRHRWPQRRERPYIDCKVCGLPFQPAAPNGKYCSDICRAKARYERGRTA